MFSFLYDDLRASIEALRWGLLRHGMPPLSIAATADDLVPFLWSEERGEDLEALVARAASAKRALFGGAIFPVAPLYVSSVCRERCTYCNYRAANSGLKIDRIRLTPEELENEAGFLVREKGLRAIELVYASDPKMTADVICGHVERVRHLLDRQGGGIVGINAEPFEEEEYRRIRDAGAAFSIVWQETYDRSRYDEVHPGGSRKSDFVYRLECYERMLAAGIEPGMGVLSGLSDWRFDWAMLMRHEAYLRRRYARGAAILGVPRLKPALGAILKTSPFTPDDDSFILAIALHNLFSPETRVFVSTRESWDLCVRMAHGGGCLFTFNCSTIPGGYSLGRSGDQFPTSSYDAPLFASRLQELGYSPRFDWGEGVAAGADEGGGRLSG